MSTTITVMPFVSCRYPEGAQDCLAGLIIQRLRRFITEQKLWILRQRSIMETLCCSHRRITVPENWLVSPQPYFLQNCPSIQRILTDLKSKLHILQCRQIWHHRLQNWNTNPISSQGGIRSAAGLYIFCDIFSIDPDIADGPYPFRPGYSAPRSSGTACPTTTTNSLIRKLIHPQL